MPKFSKKAFGSYIRNFFAWKRDKLVNNFTNSAYERNNEIYCLKNYSKVTNDQ
ncbi:hypothetical protein BpHYR1_047250 [Brachionus plicatilis]|uniref:Uncharacterized protein n=1 Tax=Brachionus plicatilis TaxID=10195 RepID=A0A3M7R3G5_BRAPC|nr:hypothetical protein BpHYR1_047250 [Brachionus plicatilis]